LWRPPAAHGLSDPSRAYGFGVVATDYYDDGFVDVFVANDSNPNFLYHKLGNGRFEARTDRGVAVNGDARAQAGMGGRRRRLRRRRTDGSGAHDIRAR